MSDVKAEIGLIGLAVMGQNLVLNMNDKGFSVAVYNRTTQKTVDFLAGPAEGRDTIIGSETLEEFVSKLESPRKVMLMVKAGEVVDTWIDKLIPLLDKGDLIIDGGNSHFPDTIRRHERLKELGLMFIGTGVSGGEEGARHGPSIMPGGEPKAWPLVKPILQAIAAKTADGTPCCDWVGSGGAGHYVKMVHNGIEYGDMQLISEAYHLMHRGMGLSHAQMHEIFASWNEGELDSYLIEITRDIMAFADDDGSPLVEKIVDSAGQKGTGKWTAVNALEAGMPVTLIGEAVFARFLSALTNERAEAAKVLPGPTAGQPYGSFSGEKTAFLDAIKSALYASKIISYTQGFMLMREASAQYDWNIDYGAVADMWRGGCIIRSRFLGDIRRAFTERPDLPSLLVADFFTKAVATHQQNWRTVVAEAATLGIPVPAMSTALAFYDGYRSGRLPANLIQAQRDYFGAHTYERTDKPRGEFFHTNWTGSGGDVASGTYNA